MRPRRGSTCAICAARSRRMWCARLRTKSSSSTPRVRGSPAARGAFAPLAAAATRSEPHAARVPGTARTEPLPRGPVRAKTRNNDFRPPLRSRAPRSDASWRTATACSACCRRSATRWSRRWGSRSRSARKPGRCGSRTWTARGSSRRTSPTRTRSSRMTPPPPNEPSVRLERVPPTRTPTRARARARALRRPKKTTTAERTTTRKSDGLSAVSRTRDEMFVDENVASKTKNESRSARS